MIRLRTLGTLDLRAPDGSEIRSVLAQPRRLAPLVYLALAMPRGFQRRDRLLALFWPDDNVEKARASLNRAIHFLRRELGEDSLVSRGHDEIGLNRDRFSCDAVDLEEALDGHRWRDALGLYKGDILPGFFVSGAGGFEEWLEVERARLRERLSQAAWALAEEEEKAGNLGEAAQSARRGMDLSPFGEIGLRRLLALLDRAGDRAGAGHAYHQFEQQLAAELELSPSPETRALIDAIRSRAQATGHGEPAHVDDGVQEARPSGDRRPKASSGFRAHSVPSRAIRRGAAMALVVSGVAIVARIGWPSPDPRRVQVVSFESSGSDDRIDRLGRQAVEGIVQSLTNTGLVEVAASGIGHSTNGTSALANGLFAALRRPHRRAGTIVSGAIQAEAGRIVVQASITDVQRGRVVWVVRPPSERADSAERTVNELRDRVAGAVAALMTPRFASWFPIATSPPTFDAWQEFAQGVELQVRGFDRDAVPYLQRAVQTDTTFTWARLQLALAYLNLFEEANADSIIEGLNRDRERLPPLQRHWLDWMLSFKTEDWPGAYRAIHAAAQLAPVRFLYNEAQLAGYLNRPREAIRVLTRLGPENPYTGGNDGYWGLLSSSYHALGDGDRELAVAREARRHAVDPVNALSFELRALSRLGRIPEVRALLDTALTLAKEREPAPMQVMVGIARWASPALLMVATARELRAHGHEDAAMEMLARALAWYRAQPVNGAMTGQQFEIGQALYLARDWSAAAGIFRSLLAADPGNFILEGYVGTVAARQGDSVTARRIIARFDTLRSTLNRPHAEAGYWQGKIAALLGDPEHAMEWWKESMGAQGRGGAHTDFDFELFWGTKSFQEFVRPKG